MNLICTQAGKQSICEDCHHSKVHDSRSDHEMNLGDCTISSPCYDPDTGKTINRVYCVETINVSELDTLSTKLSEVEAERDKYKLALEEIVKLTQRFEPPLLPFVPYRNIARKALEEGQMSDLWSMKCRDCGGSGKDVPFSSSCPNGIPCHACHGSGGMELVVGNKCRTCEVLEYATVCKSPECYRPLSEQEVEEVKCTEPEPQECPTEFNSGTCYTCEYCEYEGQRVTLRAKGE